MSPAYGYKGTVANPNDTQRQLGLVSEIMLDGTSVSHPETSGTYPKYHDKLIPGIPSARVAKNLGLLDRPLTPHPEIKTPPSQAHPLFIPNLTASPAQPPRHSAMAPLNNRTIISPRLKNTQRRKKQKAVTYSSLAAPPPPDDYCNTSPRESRPQPPW